MSQLRAGRPLTVAGLTLIPIERISIDAATTGPGCLVKATKEPVTIVVCDGRAAWATNMQARQVSLDDLMGQVDNLASLLQDCQQ